MGGAKRVHWAQFTWPCVGLHVSAKGHGDGINDRHGCLTRIVATFVDSLQRQVKYHWSGEVLL